MTLVICPRCKKEMRCDFRIFTKQRAWVFCWLQNHGYYVGNEIDIVKKILGVEK